MRLGMATLALAAVCAPATAQEWSASIGGFMIAGAGYVDAETHNAELEVVNDAEVIVNFRLVADNGLTFGAKVEFEASGTSENADEYVAFVTGPFGRLEIGREDGAADRILLDPAGCNLSCSASGDGFLFDYAAGEAGPAIDNDLDDSDTGDSMKITYFTPSFAGLSAGASYTPGDEGAGGTSTSGRFDDNEGYELGLRWNLDLGGMMGDPDAELDTTAAFVDVGGTGTDDRSFGFATDLAVYGFDLSARYVNAGEGFEESLAVGVGYTTGPWMLGLVGVTVLSSDRRDDGDFAISAEVDYRLAPGVLVAGVVEYADYDFTDPAEERDGGFALGVLTRLDF